MRVYWYYTYTTMALLDLQFISTYAGMLKFEVKILVNE